MTTAFTDADVDATLLGACLHCPAVTADYNPAAHAPDCPIATGLGTARGAYTVDGEVCDGCRHEFAPGEAYVAGADRYVCLGCAAMGTTSRGTRSR